MHARVYLVVKVVTLIRKGHTYEALLKELENKNFSKVPVFELSLSKETSARLMAKYRYVEVMFSGEKTQRITLQPDKVLAACALSTPNIKLKFYQFSHTSEGVSQVEFSGKYAPLRLVMHPDRKAVGKASFRIPFELNDETLYLTVSVK